MEMERYWILKTNITRVEYFLGWLESSWGIQSQLIESFDNFLNQIEFFYLKNYKLKLN